MESCTLKALVVTATATPRNGIAEKSSLYGQMIRLSNARKCPFAGRVKFLEHRAPASAKFSSRTIEAALNANDSKEDDLAFVAGATGRVGSRTVRELLKLGFRVRAGVRSANKAEGLVQSVRQMKIDADEAKDGLQPVEKLELVECDLEKPEQLVPALGNASVVLCCIGASEKEVLDITGPYRIDYQATKNLINAATSAKVNHFIMVSSLGTNKLGFPAAILNLFWGVLIWKRQAEEALIASGIPYTIVRPGGMERPTDAYKLTHNMILSEEDTLFGGQVSNLQVAELMAVIAKNRSLSYCKVVEVIAETTAPLTPMEELLSKIPSQRDEPKVTTPAASSVSSPADVAVSEPPSASTVKDTAGTESVVPRPLSPYSAYDDLKPPTSPSPIPPTIQKESEEISDAASEVNASGSETIIAESTPGIDQTETEPAEVKKPQALSPYTAYDDLKPPSSPSPTPSGSTAVVSGSSIANESVDEPTGGNGAAAVQVPNAIEEKPQKESSLYRSPYYVYSDFKPPTSPSPSSPTPPPPSTASLDPSDNGAAKPSAPIEGNDEPDSAEKKPRPLSPYAMYEDLKPPTTPTPFPSNS